MAPSKENKRRLLADQETQTITTTNVKIKVLRNNPKHETSAPIIGYFPSGYDPLKQQPSNSSVKLYTKYVNGKNTRMQLVVNGSGSESGSELNFVGSTHSGEASTPALCNYALGVFDKDTGVLRVVPVAANRIFRLVPRVELCDEGRRERSVGRLENYMSMRDSRRAAQREARRQAVDPGTQEDFGQRLNGIQINTGAIEATDSTTDAQNVPPYDLNATEPAMAYPLDKIILAGEWEYLLDIFQLAEGGLEAKPAKYPSFVCNRISKLKEIEDESKRKTMAGILSYITHLIKFKDEHSMDGVESAKLHTFPRILSHRFSSMFDTTNGNSIPDEKQKLLINYILVLSLIADDFRSDSTDIANDLCMSPVELRDYYGYLGCTLERKSSLVLLRAPLKFKTLRRKRRRGSL